MKAVILAAGKGTRMRALGELVPKPLLPLANVPSLAWALAGLRSAGVDRALIVVGHLARAIESGIGDGREHGLSLQYVLQREARGTGHALLLARDWIGDEPFVAMYGDVVCSRRDFGAFLDRHRRGDADGLIAVYPVAEPWLGAVVCVQNDRVTDLVEKPPPGSVPSDLINAGLFAFPPEVFEVLAALRPTERNEIELPCALRALIERGRRIAPYPMQGFWVNLTDPAALLEANRCVLRERSELGERLVSQTAQVDPMAIVRGPVAVAEGARIGRARIGPDASLGERAAVGDGAALRNCLLLHDVRIGEEAVVENAVIGPGVELTARSRVAGTSEPALVLP